MEKRLLLAIVISFLIIFLYQRFFLKPPEPEKLKESKLIEKIKEKKQPEIQKIKTEKETGEFIEKNVVEEKNIKEIKVETSLFSATFLNKGGVLKSLKMKKYKDEKGSNLELISQKNNDNLLPLSLKTGSSEIDKILNTSLYSPSEENITLKNGQRKDLIFYFSDGKSISGKKKYSFTGGIYTMDIENEIYINNEKKNYSIILTPRIGNPPEEDLKSHREYIVFLNLNNLKRIDTKKLKDGKLYDGYLTWAAYDSTYFTEIAIVNEQSSISIITPNSNKSNEKYLKIFKPNSIYFGPKDYDLLRSMGNQMEKVIDFGFFGIIAKILLKALKSIHSFIPNYGFSIILLTLILKVILFPLTWSSSISMAKMQKIQPKMKAIREKYRKYKTDPEQRKKMNEEIMKLYKSEGINPAGGCLPLILQIPILWGFFNLLSKSIEMRHQPFIFWIKDLSKKDPYFVTPILMGATQFILQKMTPTGGDPAQRKLMMFMPVFMTIFFLNFQSGLVLYWLTQNILQIGQQYLINKFIYKKEHGEKRIQRKKS
ncbi:MAG: membrane protein insertase YidC [Acidobacteriota bacterium]